MTSVNLEMRLKLLCLGKHRVGMSIDFHTAPDPGDLAVRADQNRCTKNAFVHLAVQRLFTPGAIGRQHRLRGIGEERNAKLELVAKLLLCLLRVRGNAKDRGAGGLELGGEAGEVHGLTRTARRAGAWVEEDHQFATPVVAERDRGAAVAWHPEGRRLGA